MLVGSNAGIFKKDFVGVLLALSRTTQVAAKRPPARSSLHIAMPVEANQNPMTGFGSGVIYDLNETYSS